jgi:hypothetical protein
MVAFVLRAKAYFPVMVYVLPLVERDPARHMQYLPQQSSPRRAIIYCRYCSIHIDSAHCVVVRPGHCPAAGSIAAGDSHYTAETCGSRRRVAAR